MKKTAKNHQKPQTERESENVAATFDELIHSPNRLRICAALAAVAEIEFANLERSVGITTQLMSK